MSNSNIDKGIITYIYLENFVTYSKVIVKPGRNLNVIIGPNGTGKSTIVCAIVLGLGGKPTTLGRSSQVGDYVKAGCNEAKIEIHLKNGKNRDVVICRTFNTQGKSSWLLDKNQSNIKEIQDLTRNFDIQIDNLCQFLPQDKVQEFSKMNSQELLENTERSVGDPIILEHHKQLIQYRSDHKDTEVQIASKQKLLTLKTQIYEGLKETVSSIKERKLIKRKIVTLKQKKAWILYDQKRKELHELQGRKKKAVAKMASLEAEMQPTNDLINKTKSEIEVLQNSVADHKNKVSKLKRMMDDILDCENNIKECENTCKQRIQTEEARDHDINVAEQQKNKLDNDLSAILKDIECEEALKRKQDLFTKIQEQRSMIAMLTNKNAALKQEEDRINLEIRAQETERQVLNIEAKRLQLLREKSMDTYRAVEWLRENHDKFSGIVHEPILLNINVKDVQYAKYLENIIAFRELIAFVCENKQDMNMLLHHLRDVQKLQVNVIHSDPTRVVSMVPIVPLENIKRFGFTHYLVSLIEAPTTIMKYLVNFYNLHNIPVGTSLVDENIDHIPSNINRYFSKTKSYSLSKSKYTGQKSIGIHVVSSTGMLSIVLDKSKLLKIEEELKSLRERKNSVFKKIEQIEKQICEQNKELDRYRASRSEIHKNLQQIEALKSRISMIEKKIENLQKEQTSIDKIRESSTNDIKVILNKQLNVYETYNNELEACFKYIIDNEQIQLALKLQNRFLRMKVNKSQDLREKLKEAENRVRQLTSEINPMLQEVQRMYNEALEITNGIGPSDKKFTAINKAFSKLPPTVEEINNELHTAQAKVFCMGNNVDGESTLHEYEKVETEICELKEFIQKKTGEIETLTQRVQTLREKWLQPLSIIVEKINSNFSSYFSAMGCAGEVILVQPENIMDFDKYGLKIMVKFRDIDQLQELTRNHQSGGERAVTTAIYMISLQELSRVPFRCVDEINQGMDAVNERRVFNLLVQMTGRPNSSQYFLLTPKLLPNLKYSETVTVHCVFNGPFMIRHTEFDMKEYCKHVSKTMEKENEDDD
ncbi:LOW QUALITY PROTEIN: structural maintenance of chromosomes protein 5 [Hylaeus volcanicus]|uniref:LOW QUALITY PROTEIN: structural maintenance of chromosomes protein 5 n=1 Tax=Hylaeus volcanicus TaxID=313075 RepID=UPI0023B82C47|nr:LOW QUALITY PROTEIN: structural maintenance of chromosomes protein 5 [Hylaeus volcanicus]